MDRLREVFVNLEEENKRKDEYIREIEKKNDAFLEESMQKYAYIEVIEKKLKSLEEENKQKDECIREIEKKFETLDVEKDLLEQRNDYLHEKIKKNDSFIKKVLNIQFYLNEATLSVDTTNIKKM